MREGQVREGMRGESSKEPRARSRPSGTTHANAPGPRARPRAGIALSRRRRINDMRALSRAPGNAPAHKTKQNKPAPPTLSSFLSDGRAAAMMSGPTQLLWRPVTAEGAWGDERPGGRGIRREGERQPGEGGRPSERRAKGQRAQGEVPGINNGRAFKRPPPHQLTSIVQGFSNAHRLPPTQLQAPLGRDGAALAGAGAAAPGCSESSEVKRSPPGAGAARGWVLGSGAGQPPPPPPPPPPPAPAFFLPPFKFLPGDAATGGDEAARRWEAPPPP